MKRDFHRFACGARRALGSAAFAASVTVAGAALAASDGHDAPRKMSPAAKPVEHDSKVFGSDPSYKDKPYDAKEQIKIYGGKTAVDAPRPVVELGRPIYVEGTFGDGINLFGDKNLLFPAFNISGDWRTAVAFNDNGNVEVGQIATRLNLELDFKFRSLVMGFGYIVWMSGSSVPGVWKLGLQIRDHGWEAWELGS